MSGRYILFIFIVICFWNLSYCLPPSHLQPEICPKGNGLFPKEGSLCKSYYRCSNWVAVEETCPDGQHFNPAEQWCDWDDLYPCFEKPKAIECPRPNGKFLKKSTDCKVYYECWNSKPYEEVCPSDQIFNPALGGYCEWPELYTCVEDIVPTSSSTEKQLTKFTSPTVATSPTFSTSRHSTAKIDVTSPNVTLYSEITTVTSGKNDYTSESLLHSSDFILTSTTKSTDQNEATSSAPTTVSNLSPSSEGMVTSTTEISTSATSENPYLVSTTGTISGKIRNITDSKETPMNNSTDWDENKYKTPTSVFSSSQYTKIATASPKSTSYEIPLTKSTVAATVSESPNSSVPEITKDKTTDENTSIVSTTISSIFPSSPHTASKSTSFFTSDIGSKSTTNFSSRVSSTSTSKTTDRKASSTTNGNLVFKTSSMNPEDLSSEEIDFDCPEPTGIFPHPTNKHKFIGCTDDVPVTLNCPEDLIYDHKIKACTYK